MRSCTRSQRLRRARERSTRVEKRLEDGRCPTRCFGGAERADVENERRGTTGDEARARDDLDEAIAILVARPEVDAALADATSAMQARFTDEAFERQVALVREKQALELRLANLVQSNEDARAFDAEDD